MTRAYVRAPVGKRLTEPVPRNRGTVTTSLWGLTLEGIVVTMILQRGPDGDVFAALHWLRHGGYQDGHAAGSAPQAGR